tara:strand:+ start:184 stop:339 length:156 start_codon:yes stop_codon:yes gene_type:complete
MKKAGRYNKRSKKPIRILSEQDKKDLAKRRNSIEKYKPPPKEEEPLYPLFL